MILQEEKTRFLYVKDPAAIDYFYDEEFSDPCERKALLAELPRRSTPQGPNPPSDLPSYLAHLWRIPLLSPDQEHHAFRRFNFLKHLAFEARRDILGDVGCFAMVEVLDGLIQEIYQARNFLVESNLRLVISIAKRRARGAPNDFDEMVCVGNAALIRAVDLFDFRRGTRFSTYAYQAIERSISGLYRRESRFRQLASLDEPLNRDAQVDEAAEFDRDEIEAKEVRRDVHRIIGRLDGRSQYIVKSRFGLNQHEYGVPFHVIASEIGLSTTRTVQLFHRSLKLMRDAAVELGLENAAERRCRSHRSFPLRLG